MTSALPAALARSISLTLALTLALTVALTLAPVSSASARPARVEYAAAALKATNAERVDRDRAELRKSRCLTRLARRQARRMARRQELFHQVLGLVQLKCLMGWVGENVAMGYPDGKSAVRGWMKSPGHRANILHKPFRRMGIAAVKRHGVWWVAQVFGARI